MMKHNKWQKCFKNASPLVERTKICYFFIRFIAFDFFIALQGFKQWTHTCIILTTKQKSIHLHQSLNWHNLRCTLSFFSCSFAQTSHADFIFAFCYPVSRWKIIVSTNTPCTWIFFCQRFIFLHFHYTFSSMQCRMLISVAL